MQGLLGYETLPARCCCTDAFQAHDEWEALKNDPSTKRDEGGPAQSRLRLAVPAWMLGLDFYEDKKSNFMESQVQQKRHLFDGSLTAGSGCLLLVSV